MKRSENPFKGPCYDGQQTFHVAAGDRIGMVKKFDKAQCEAALQVPGLQKTVENAVKVRLRQLDGGTVKRKRSSP
ncbi:hypothetical protein [Cupriavidus taiwanensis]|uniref:Uncharacterized protein n=1 Tax=Cupriavidus taiwanensis (strain DSM 17343 / BCRC 17206 / CCUG 44338 / CIP 107171 / LMG 19424 / R1) TaxID=977880 RepID=B3R9K8_CUPTR|nr:hypothetical protein [Cupriavidus taiwanensis]CAQ71583.1 hypothetical protein RALTA_B0972 [Cupriavidus taiwanensis LMG 19424]